MKVLEILTKYIARELFLGAPRCFHVPVDAHSSQVFSSWDRALVESGVRLHMLAVSHEHLARVSNGGLTSVQSKEQESRNS